MLIHGSCRQIKERHFVAVESGIREEVATTTRYASLSPSRNIIHHPSTSTTNILSDPPSISKQAASDTDSKDVKATSNADIAQPLAPPPRPASLQQQQSTASEGGDYFSAVHNSQYSLEPNLFEQSFGNPSTETPGKSLLPPVAALTSPAPLTGNASLGGGGYSWSNSLRSGPLSPAMLSGPTGTGDYFDSHLRGGFPTPNESSLRTGLTPGGGGSMFPAPSPNSQALFSQLANGGATPSTLDFHRTAMNVAAARKNENQAFGNQATTQPQEQRAQVANMEQQQPSHQHFGQHDNDAANGLFLLAQAGNETQSNNQFAMPTQPAHTMAGTGASQDTSPNLAKRATRNAAGSIGGSVGGSIQDQSEMSAEMSDNADQSRPNTRGKAKKNSAGKGANARRKAEETPSKQPAAKKAKANNGNTSARQMAADMDMSMEGMDSDEDQNIKEEQYHENGKKMTDEEKRKNFLERNRYGCVAVCSNLLSLILQTESQRSNADNAKSSGLPTYKPKSKSSAAKTTPSPPKLPKCAKKFSTSKPSSSPTRTVPSPNKLRVSLTTCTTSKAITTTTLTLTTWRCRTGSRSWLARVDTHRLSFTANSQSAARGDET